MTALARNCVAAIAVLISVAAALAQLSPAAQIQFAWRPAYFETLAHALSPLVTSGTPVRPVWAPFIETALCLLAGLSITLLMLAGRTRSALALGVGAALAAGVASAALFVLKLQLVDPMTPVLLLTPAFLVGAFASVVRRALAANSRPAQSALRVVGRAVRGTERRGVTILACEIRDLEALVRSYEGEPQSLTKIVSGIVTTMSELAQTHNGTIEQLTPSGLVAVFNAPTEDVRDAEHATEAALMMIGQLAPLNEKFEKLAGPQPFTPIAVSVGIECGEVLVGNFGLGVGNEMSTLGAARFAAHLLAQRAHVYGPAILVGPQAQGRLEAGFALLQLDLGEIGLGAPAPFYALMGNPVLRANPRFKALQEGFDTFHSVYRKGNWDQAGALITQCAKLPGANARLIALYQRRVAFLKSHKPEGDWNGILRLPIE